MSEKHKIILSLYYYEDLNLKEIGRVLRITESRVSQLHAQAILRLKAKLSAYLDKEIQRQQKDMSRNINNCNQEKYLQH